MEHFIYNRGDLHHEICFRFVSISTEVVEDLLRWIYTGKLAFKPLNEENPEATTLHRRERKTATTKEIMMEML